METIQITSTLGILALYYEYTIVCDDIKGIMEKIGESDSNNEVVQRQVELVNPKEYTRADLFKEYDRKAIVIKWVDTYTEDGHEAMAVVLE